MTVFPQSVARKNAARIMIPPKSIPPGNLDTSNDEAGIIASFFIYFGFYILHKEEKIYKFLPNSCPNN